MKKLLKLVKDKLHYAIWGPEIDYYLDPIERFSGDWAQQLTYVRDLEDAISKVYLFDSRGHDIKPALVELYDLVPHLRG